MIQDLNLGSNPLGTELSFDDDYEFSFQNLENLKTLDLSNCSLPDFPKALIEGSKSLKKLDLSRNFIQALNQDLFTALPDIEQLDLSGNLIKEVKNA